MHAHTIEELRERIRAIEGPRRSAGKDGLPTGVAALDELLPDGGLRPGTLTEWLGDGAASGAAAVALAVASHVLRRGGALLVIDGAGEFYAPGAAGLGVPLERTVLVRPDAPLAALWAWEQALRCPGVAVVFGRVETTDDRLLRRLQLAAEEGGGLGFLLRPPGCRPGAGWSAMRIHVQSIPRAPREDRLTRRLRLRLAGRGTAEVELSDEAGDVPVVSELADPTAARRPAVG